MQEFKEELRCIPHHDAHIFDTLERMGLPELLKYHQNMADACAPCASSLQTVLRATILHSNILFACNTVAPSDCSCAEMAEAVAGSLLVSCKQFQPAFFISDF